jgi:hypothetical protein
VLEAVLVETYVMKESLEDSRNIVAQPPLAGENLNEPRLDGIPSSKLCCLE